MAVRRHSCVFAFMGPQGMRRLRVAGAPAEPRVEQLRRRLRIVREPEVPRIQLPAWPHVHPPPPQPYLPGDAQAELPGGAGA